MTWKQELPHILNTMDLKKIEKFISKVTDDAHLSGQRIGKQVEREGLVRKVEELRELYSADDCDSAFRAVLTILNTK